MPFRDKKTMDDESSIKQTLDIQDILIDHLSGSTVGMARFSTKEHSIRLVKDGQLYTITIKKGV